MTQKGQHIDIDELFRKNLENTSLMPSPDASSRIMRKLQAREFVRFNPSRFNVFYLAAAVAAAVTLTFFALGPGRPTTGKVQTIVSDQSMDTLRLSIGKGIKEGPTGGADNKSLNENSASKEVSSFGNNVNVQKDIIIKHAQIVGGKTADTVSLKSGVLSKGLDPGTSAKLFRRITAAFEPSTRNGCVPLRVRFRNMSEGYDSCRWSFGDGGNSKLRNPEWIFDQDGDYRVTLDVYSREGNSTSYSCIVSVYPAPVAHFVISPEKPIIPDDNIRFMNYSKDAVRFLWSFGDGSTSDAFEPEHKYQKFAGYNVSLVAWSDHGCADTLTLPDAFAGSGAYINFPNAFIPNQDGPTGGSYSAKSDENAQVFHPVTTGVTEYQLRIFSKRGILIFESNDINTGWDGYHKGQLCEPGVYIWKVRGTFRSGEPFVKMGDVTLLRQ
ncbi:MAG: PKD domain-containing protein [Bacteroidales bacterium]